MVVPGIFEPNFDEVKKKLELIQDTAPLVQIDIADGVLVDGKTFLEPHRLDELDIHTNLELHMMVEDPEIYLQTKITKVVNVYSQIEIQNVARFIMTAKSKGYKVGLSLNPETSLEALTPYLQSIDLVQFMTVIPGAQGRPLEKEVLAKIKKFKAAYPQMPVQIDGGFNKESAQMLAQTGIDSAEAGASIFHTDNPVEAYKELSNLFNTYKMKP